MWDPGRPSEHVVFAERLEGSRGASHVRDFGEERSSLWEQQMQRPCVGGDG